MPLHAPTTLLTYAQLSDVNELLMMHATCDTHKLTLPTADGARCVWSLERKALVQVVWNVLSPADADQWPLPGPVVRGAELLLTQAACARAFCAGNVRRALSGARPLEGWTRAAVARFEDDLAFDELVRRGTLLSAYTSACVVHRMFDECVRLARIDSLYWFMPVTEPPSFVRIVLDAFRLDAVPVFVHVWSQCAAVDASSTQSAAQRMHWLVCRELIRNTTPSLSDAMFVAVKRHVFSVADVDRHTLPALCSLRPYTREHQYMLDHGIALEGTQWLGFNMHTNVIVRDPSLSTFANGVMQTMHDLEMLHYDSGAL